MFEVYVPIAPQIEHGTIVVNIHAISQIVKQTFNIELEILVKYQTISIFQLLLID